jgi:hypothetical protein
LVYFDGDLFLDRKPKERLLVGWKTDAIGGEPVLGSCCLLGAFNSVL